MEELFSIIRQYLPIFLDPEEQDFINYIEKAYYANIESQTYQFSFLAFHMMYMAFIYKTLWLLNERKYSSFTTLLKLHHPKVYELINSPYDFSEIDETPTFNLLKCLGFHKNELEIFSQYVKKRNHCAHSSGKINYDEEEISNFIRGEIKNVEKILTKSRNNYFEITENFINDNWDKKGRVLSTTFDSIGNFISQNKFSQRDMYWITCQPRKEFDIESDIGEMFYKKILLLNLYGYMIFNSDLSWIDYTDKFLQNFNSLFLGFPKRKKNRFMKIIEEEFYFIFPIIPDKSKELIYKKIAAYF